MLRLEQRAPTAVVVAERRAMATRATIKIPDDVEIDASDRGALETALDAFTQVDRTCSRFSPRSELSELNREPARRRKVSALLLRALEAASDAHDLTHGRFDPRVLSDLIALGYTRTLRFGEETVVELERTERFKGPWRPWLDRGRSSVQLDGWPIDLGGIGKGLAVDMASQHLAGVLADFLVEAGGDGACAGSGPDGDDWLIGVEDPTGRPEPIAVLALRNCAFATSSTSVRTWRTNRREVHHLLNPITGQPARTGLRAVTVVGGSAQHSEVWSKSLFIAGIEQIGALARHHGLAALWVGDDGQVAWSASMRRHLRWTRA